VQRERRVRVVSGLTTGCYEAIEANGSDEQKHMYLASSAAASGAARCA